jgi:hypothetical protein
MKEVKTLFGLDLGALERLQKIHDDHERVKKRYAKRPMGKAQLTILARLYFVWTREKAIARHSRTRFQGGWTHVRCNRFTRLESLQGLLRRGLATACCDGHDGRDMVRLSPDGLAFCQATWPK